MSLRPLLPFCFLSFLPVAAAQTAPSFDGEKLNYTVNWPSGLSLGEARLEAKLSPAEGAAAARWTFEFTLDASVPGFPMADRFRSAAGPDLCSLELEKDSTHGKRKAREKTVIDAQKGKASRQTIGGGKSEIPVPACVRDGLAFLYYFRRELALGRIPPDQTILFGSPYRIRVQYGGAQAVQVGDTRIEADRLTASLKGPASEISFDVFFSRDAARTPVMVKVPFSMGVFSMELVR